MKERCGSMGLQGLYNKEFTLNAIQSESSVIEGTCIKFKYALNHVLDKNDHTFTGTNLIGILNP